MADRGRIIDMIQDVRLELLTQWVHQLTDWQAAQITVASADASFRRYFRVQQQRRTAIVMDAPDDQAGLDAFIDISERLQRCAVPVPAIWAQNRLDGFLLLEDLGDTLLLDRLTAISADELYQLALNNLLRIQQADPSGLPIYDHVFLRQEIDLMPTWFLGTHLGLQAQDQPLDLLEASFNWLVNELMQQPAVFVHRDYHSRNLMLTEQPNKPLAVIDYQGALLGPISYDLVSLLRDCYIVWPQQRVAAWVDAYRKAAIEMGLLQPVDRLEFLRWFDLMGLQRHLKVLGIFARLHHRDGKSAYLNDLPLTLSYVLLIGSRYPEMAPFIAWMRSVGIPERIGTTVISS